MTILGLVEAMMLVNMGLFIGLLTMWLHPDGLVSVLVGRLQHRHEEAAPEVLEGMARHLVAVYTWVGCGVVLSWALATGFVFGLYRGGFFSR